MNSGYIDIPVEGGGGGTGNILSINGDTSANQFIVGGTNIAVVSGAGINTINLNGPVPISLGGTGQSNQQAALNNLTDIGSHSNGDVLQLLAGNAQFAAAPAPTLAQISAAIGAPANSFIFSDATSQIVGYGNWHIDPTTFFSNVDNFDHPDNLGQAPVAYGWNINVDPLQNSPNDSLRLHSFNVNLDSSAAGFQFGSNGQAAELLGGGYNYGGNGATIGLLRNINMFGGFGNGTDPGTFKGIVASAHSFNFSANTTIDGQVQGYDFNVNINASAITTSNFNVLWLTDFSQYPVDVYGYQGLVCQPNIATIKNNHNYNGASINSNITLMEGNAGFYGFQVGGTITSAGTSGCQQFSSNTNIGTLPATSNFLAFSNFSQITTMAATSNYQGVSIGPTITTLHGNMNGYQSFPQITGGDGQVQLFNGGMGSVHTTGQTSVLNLNGQTADGNQSSFNADGIRTNLGGTLNVLSGQGVQGQHVIFTSYVQAGAGTVTGTDVLCNILSPDVDFGTVTDNLTLGPTGLGFNMVAFAGQMHGHGTIAQVSAVLPAAIFAEDFTLPEYRNVNAIVINAGYSGVCTNATAFYHEIQGAGLFATNHWGLRVVTDIDNFVTKMAINTSTQKVASANVRLQLENGHVKSSQTTPPTVAAQSGAGTGASASLTNATDVAGNIEIDLGTLTLAAGAQAIVTFNQTYAVAPIVLLTPTNATAASNVAVFGVYTTSSTSTFTVNFASAGVALSTLKWNYQVIETQ